MDIDGLNRFEALPQVGFSLHDVILVDFGLVWPLMASLRTEPILTSR